MGNSDAGLAPARAPSNRLLASMRLTAVLVYTTIQQTIYLIGRALTRGKRRVRWQGASISFWCRAMRFIFGIRVERTGAEIPPGSLIVANHIGYVDVPAMGGLAPLHFIVRGEYDGLPVAGMVLRSLDSPIATRQATRGLGALGDLVRERLASGASICGFLEGTSSGGDRVMPIRNPILQSAIDAGAMIVPVALRWSCDDPRVDIADDVAYWKDHELGAHAWRLLGLRGVRVRIVVGDPIDTHGANRKALAQQVRDWIATESGLPPMPDNGWRTPERPEP